MEKKFFKAALEGKNDWWRYLLTMILVLIGWQFIGVIPIFAVALSYAENFEQLLEILAVFFDI